MKSEALLFMATNERFSIEQCQQLAKDLDAFDSMAFDLVGPSGSVGARWLDAYFGLFVIDGQEGFVSASRFQYLPDIHCENLRLPEKSA